MLFVWNVASPLLPLLAADQIVVKTDDLRSLAAAPAVLERLSRWEVLYAQGGVSVLRYPEALPRAFVAPAWRGVPESGGSEELTRLAEEGGLAETALIAEAAVAEGKGTGGGGAELREEGPNRIQVRLEGQTGPGMLVVLDNYAPGWNAREEETGRPLPVYRADLTFRGVPVSGETGSVEMRYEPASFRVGLYLAMVAVGFLAGLLVGRAGGARGRSGEPGGALKGDGSVGWDG
jgi:hypothetical protein